MALLEWLVEMRLKCNLFQPGTDPDVGVVLSTNNVFFSGSIGNILYSRSC